VAGVVVAGVVVAGVVVAGVVVAGVVEAGVVEAGVVEAGVVEAGVVEAGVVEAGVVEAGVVTSRDHQPRRLVPTGPTLGPVAWAAKLGTKRPTNGTRATRPSFFRTATALRRGTMCIRRPSTLPGASLPPTWGIRALDAGRLGRPGAAQRQFRVAVSAADIEGSCVPWNAGPDAADVKWTGTGASCSAPALAPAQVHVAGDSRRAGVSLEHPPDLVTIPRDRSPQAASSARLVECVDGATPELRAMCRGG